MHEKPFVQIDFFFFHFIAYGYTEKNEQKKGNEFSSWLGRTNATVKENTLTQHLCWLHPCPQRHRRTV